MRLAYENPKSFASGQSVTWMCETVNSSTVPIEVRVVNVINGWVLIRVAKKTGEVYFKAVSLNELTITSKSD